MNAAEALSDTRLRARVVASAHASPRAVADLLRGYAPGRGGLAGAIRSALVDEGVDLGTVQTRTPEELEAHAASRRPQCRRCRELQRELLDLQAECARLRRDMDAASRTPAPRLTVAG